MVHLSVQMVSMVILRMLANQWYLPKPWAREILGFWQRSKRSSMWGRGNLSANDYNRTRPQWKRRCLATSAKGILLGDCAVSMTSSRNCFTMFTFFQTESFNGGQRENSKVTTHLEAIQVDQILPGVLLFSTHHSLMWPPRHKQFHSTRNAHHIHSFGTHWVISDWLVIST